MTTTPMTAAPTGVGALAPALLAELRDLLTTARAEEQAQARAHLATVDALTGQADVDSGLAREAAEVAAARAEEAVGDIEAALRRLDAGTFGACERCGAAIPLERLRAIPHARSCVTCPGQRGGRFW